MGALSTCEVRHLGRLGYAEAFEMQHQLAERRKRGEICNQLLFVEHPHVITLGRNGHIENLLAGEEHLRGAGIEFHHTNRGGDITYHGPGQIVGYPILDLREWKRDVVAYVRTLEQVIIDTLQQFGISGGRSEGNTGVWVDGKKIAAIGIHLSRWVTSHGFALNVNTDLSYFHYIVPCGLTKPVTSMEQLGVRARLDEVGQILAGHFGRIFDCEMTSAGERACIAGDN